MVRLGEQNQYTYLFKKHLHKENKDNATKTRQQNSQKNHQCHRVETLSLLFAKLKQLLFKHNKENFRKPNSDCTSMDGEKGDGTVHLINLFNIYVPSWRV